MPPLPVCACRTAKSTEMKRKPGQPGAPYVPQNLHCNLDWLAFVRKKMRTDASRYLRTLVWEMFICVSSNVPTKLSWVSCGLLNCTSLFHSSANGFRMARRINYCLLQKRMGSHDWLVFSYTEGRFHRSGMLLMENVLLEPIMLM